MQPVLYFAAAIIGICAVGATVLYFTCIRKNKVAVQPMHPPEECFVWEWTVVLNSDARVFNGLFRGLQRVCSGVAKRPEKTLREWCQRTHNKWENAPIDRLCREHIALPIENADREQLTKWAGLLLEASAAAGITQESAKTTVLSEKNAADYVEWDGQELSPGDTVEILAPAWYQKGILLEQGQCRKTDAE